MADCTFCLPELSCQALVRRVLAFGLGYCETMIAVAFNCVVLKAVGVGNGVREQGTIAPLVRFFCCQLRHELRTAHHSTPSVLLSANAGATCSVEEQVACLIDQATDENLLGRAWVGWEPYL